jgi:hypothetical protein
MNKTLSTVLIVIAVLVLAGGVFFAGSMYARANAYGPSMMFSNGRNDNNNNYGPSMMGRGYNNQSNNSYGPGMMGSRRGGNGTGPGMMGGYGLNNGTGSNATPLTADQAKQAAEKYIQSLNFTGLETSEVMVFDNNAYVVIKESDTGLGAFELLVDPSSQAAYPEYGPNMMWNLKYGGMNHGSMMGGSGGMMGGWNNQATPSAKFYAEMTVTTKQAVEYAQKYLDTNIAGATAATDPMQFYGYYTLDFSKDGKIIGMLSVNGYNGQIFLHTWHGTFIEES